MTALASDNIYRVPVGSEIPGTLYQLTGGLQLEDVQGYNTYLFRGEAGRERIESSEFQEENPIYRLEADMSWTSRGGSFLQIIGNASRETSTLNPPDFNQLRSLEERKEAQIITGKRYKSGGEWQGSLIVDRLDLRNILVKTIGITANAIMPISRSSDMNFEGLTRRGYGFEEDEKDEWIEGFIDMEYLYRTERRLSLGSAFYWFSAETADSTTDLTLELNNFHVTGFMQTMEAVTTPFSLEVGLDAINNVSNKWDYDLYLDASISLPLVHEVTMMGRRAELSVQVVHQPIVNRNNEVPVSLGRMGAFDAIVKWRPGKMFEIDTGFVYAMRFFADEPFLPDRDEVRRKATVGATWLITQDINLRLATILDQTDSDLDTRDLEEKRIELNFNGMF